MKQFIRMVAVLVISVPTLSAASQVDVIVKNRWNQPIRVQFTTTGGNRVTTPAIDADSQETARLTFRDKDDVTNPRSVEVEVTIGGGTVRYHALGTLDKPAWHGIKAMRAYSIKIDDVGKISKGLHDVTILGGNFCSDCT